MRVASLLPIAFIAALGFGSGSASAQYGPTTIATLFAYDSNPNVTVWANVPFTAYAVNPTCSSSDSNCITTISGTTDSSGKFTFNTDAYGNWMIQTPAGASGCPNAVEEEADLSGGQVQVVCQIAD